MEWHGVDDPRTADPAELARSMALADAARDFNWPTVFGLLRADPPWVNRSRLGGASGFAPLHQAAHGGAPLEVAQTLLDTGALRTLRTAAGERAVDVARRRGHLHLLEILEPRGLLAVSMEKLQAVEQGVHAVIRGREGVLPLLERCSMRLPPLEVLTEIPARQLWFPVPGMYGGFHLQLGVVVDEPVCLVDSWVRVVEGSEERVAVTRGGAVRLALPSWLPRIAPPPEV